MDLPAMREFASRYTQAWCSQEPNRVAAFFADGGSIAINNGPPAVGRQAIAATAAAFMTAFPDMVVRMDDLRRRGDGFTYHWTLIGTNTGPGGTGRHVQISGYEEWALGSDGLIARSLGNYDDAEYKRQLGGA